MEMVSVILLTSVPAAMTTSIATRTVFPTSVIVVPSTRQMMLTVMGCVPTWTLALSIPLTIWMAMASAVT